MRSKGMVEIEKRRKFLLGGEADANASSTATAKVAQSAKTESALNRDDDDMDMEDDLGDENLQDDFVGETIAYI